MLNLQKSDIKNKIFNEVLEEYNICSDDLNEMVFEFDLVVCSNCGEIIDNCDESRYEDSDYYFNGEKENPEYGCVLCDDCFEEEKNKGSITLI